MEFKKLIIQDLGNNPAFLIRSDGLIYISTRYITCKYPTGDYRCTIKEMVNIINESFLTEFICLNKFVDHKCDKAKYHASCGIKEIIKKINH